MIRLHSTVHAIKIYEYSCAPAPLLHSTSGLTWQLRGYVGSYESTEQPWIVHAEEQGRYCVYW